MRRRRCRDRTEHETRRADAGEIHVAAEIVGARQRRTRRRPQAGFQRHETADRGRRALAHRQPHPRELRRLAARHAQLLNPQHETVGALALLARLDETFHSHGRHRPRQHLMRQPRGLQRRGGEAREK